jgi:hypothetical protein
MNIMVENEGTHYRGMIVSYSLKWEGRVLDLRRIRSLYLHRAAQDGRIMLDDGTRLELFKTTFFHMQIKKLILKGHFLVRLSSLDRDMRFDVGSVDMIKFSSESETTQVP